MALIKNKTKPLSKKMGLGPKKKPIAKITKEFLHGKYKKIIDALKYKKNVKLAYSELENVYSDAKRNELLEKINRYKQSVAIQHNKIIELKKAFLESDLEKIKTTDRRAIARSLLEGNEIAEAPSRPAFNSEVITGKSKKTTNPTLKELADGKYNPKNKPPKRKLNEHFTDENRRRQLVIQTKKAVEKARTLNHEIAKLEAIAFAMLIEKQYATIDTEALNKKKNNLVRELYRKYKKGAISLPAFRDVLKYMNVEFEIAKIDGLIKEEKDAKYYFDSSIAKVKKLEKGRKIKDIFKFKLPFGRKKTK